MRFFTLLLLLNMLLFACKEKHEAVDITKTPLKFLDSLPGTSPCLNITINGDVIMSWVRQKGDSTYIFCYVTSIDEGANFSPVMEIPGSTNIHPHAENIPKVIGKPSGDLMAIWGTANPDPRNPYAGRIYYTQSFDKGRSWNKSQPLVDDSAGYDQRYFDVALIENGEIGMIWLDNRKTTPQEGAALYFATTNGRSGFSEEHLIAQPCCECCRVDLLREKNMHVLYRGIINDSIRDMMHMVSTDGGKTFHAPKKISDDNWVINGCPHSGPSMTQHNTGVAFAWFTGGSNSGVYYNSSGDMGKTYSQRSIVSDNGRHPQIALLKNKTLVIAFDEMMKTGNGMFSQVGLATSTGDGEKQITFITPDTLSASYPVIAPVTGGLIMACTIRKEKQTFIGYKKVGLY
jgi:hypothetical protein